MTNKQKQCLLCYLGYYAGEIDGKFGPASREATRAFQADYGLTPDGSFGPLTQAKILQVLTGNQDFWQDITYFRKEEFRCKCGGAFCDGFPAQPSEVLVRAADALRTHFAARCNVSSGVRCETHNAKVGGVANSRHLRGKAMDFCVEGKPASAVLSYIKSLPQIRYSYAIDQSYVHMDVE